LSLNERFGRAGCGDGDDDGGIVLPLRLSKKLPAQIVIVQKVKLEPCGRSLLTAIIAPAVVTGDFILNSGGALPLQLIFAEQRMSRWSIRWSSARRSITWSDRS
jgi:hypothetical protein